MFEGFLSVSGIVAGVFRVVRRISGFSIELKKRFMEFQRLLRSVSGFKGLQDVLQGDFMRLRLQ